MHLTHAQMLCAMGCLPPEKDFAWLCLRHHDQTAPRVMFHLLFLLLSLQRLACPPAEGQNMYHVDETTPFCVVGPYNKQVNCCAVRTQDRRHVMSDHGIDPLSQSSASTLVSRPFPCSILTPRWLLLGSSCKAWLGGPASRSLFSPIAPWLAWAPWLLLLLLP